MTYDEWAEQVKAAWMHASGKEPMHDSLDIDAACCSFHVDPDDPEENTPETTWHYLRTCVGCGTSWHGLHCIHDGYQNPCPGCGVRPTPMKDER